MESPELHGICTDLRMTINLFEFHCNIFTFSWIDHWYKITPTSFYYLLNKMNNIKHIPRSISKLHKNVIPITGYGSWVTNYNEDNYLDLTSWNVFFRKKRWQEEWFALSWYVAQLARFFFYIIYACLAILMGNVDGLGLGSNSLCILLIKYL